MKKVVKLFLFCFLVLSLTGCSEKLTVPDITGTDEDVAKNILSANGLIPNVNYEYSNDVAKGNVIRTVPEIGSSIEKNEKVVIYISNGPSFIKSTDSRITWWNISTNADSWEFYNPYIEDNILYIECYNVKFGQSLTWNDKYDYGNIIGIASVTDSFDKTIPVSGKYVVLV